MLILGTKCTSAEWVGVGMSNIYFYTGTGDSATAMKEVRSAAGLAHFIDIVSRISWFAKNFGRFTYKILPDFPLLNWRVLCDIFQIGS